MKKSDINIKRQQTAAKYGLKVREQRENESLESYYKSLAKLADQRLVRLEKLSKEKGFESVNKFAYAKAQEEIKRFAGESATRFNVKTPKSEKMMQAKIEAMKRFLLSPTSQKRTIIKTYQNRANTLNQKYGTNFNWESLAKYFDRGINDKADKSAGASKTALIMIGKVQSLDKDLIKEIQKADDVVKIVEDKDIDVEVANFIRDSNINWDDLK